MVHLSLKRVMMREITMSSILSSNRAYAVLRSVLFNGFNNHQSGSHPPVDVVIVAGPGPIEE
jgi:hypothetical protein